jgi:membrane protein DedA with SNARE-associated domain
LPQDIDVEALITNLGYLAVLIGTFLEGETVLAVAGLAAAHGYLSFWAIVGVAITGAFLGDQACFFIGRRYGQRILDRFPTLAAKAPRVQQIVRRWDAAAVILLRFAYGLRLAGPIVIGTCGISPWRLAFFNFLGTLLWAPLVAGIGYVAGYALYEWLGKLKHVQLGLLAGFALATAVTWLLLRRRRARGPLR